MEKSQGLSSLSGTEFVKSDTRDYEDVIIDCSKEDAAAAPTADQPPATPKTKRVATLDAFRGLTIVVIT